MLKEVSIGGDPRSYSEFAAIRDEINKLNDPNSGQIDANKITQLAFALFNKNGIDLQTLVYFAYVQTKLHDVDGFYKAIVLIARFINDFAQIWPYSASAKINILNWLISKVGNKVRTFTRETCDISFLMQMEEPLKKIVDKLRQENLATTCSLTNLYEYIHVARCNLEQQELELKEKEQIKQQVLIYSVGNVNLDHAQNHTNNENNEKVYLKQHKNNHQKHQKHQKHKQNNKLANFGNFYMLLSFLFGVFITCASFIAINYFYNDQTQVLTLNTQLFKVLPPNSSNKISLINKKNNLAKYEQQLQIISSLAPLATRIYAANLADMIKAGQAENNQSQIVKQYEQLIKVQQNDHFMRDGYFVAMLKLQKLANDLITAEQQNKSITISKLKTDVYQIQTSLNQEIPIEELLRKLNALNLTQTNNAENLEQTLILIKDIDSKFNNLLSYYHQLVNKSINNN